MKTKNNFKLLLTIFFMGTAYALIYALPFIQYVLYDPIINTLGATNAQLGVLIMIFGLGNIFGAPFGGVLSDRFDVKKVLLVSILGNALCSFLFAFNLNYSMAIVVWVGLAVTGLFGYYPAHQKIIRLLVTEEEQGKVYGLSESACGIGSVIVNFVALSLFGKVATEAGGIKLAVIGYGIMAILVTVVLFFLVPSHKKSNEEAGASGEKISLKDLLVVLKNPGVWFAGIAIFVGYSTYVSLSYFTPYFTNVLKVTVVGAGAISIIRTYLLRFIGAPIGGFMGDKMKSNSKMMVISMIGVLVLTFAFTSLKVGASFILVTAITLIIALFAYFARGNMFAIPAELKLPTKYAAITAGITCAIGFSPDLFQFTLFGNWIDQHGDKGYNYIFTYTMVVAVIGIITSILAIMYKKKLVAKLNKESNKA